MRTAPAPRRRRFWGPGATKVRAARRTIRQRLSPSRITRSTTEQTGRPSKRPSGFCDRRHSQAPGDASRSWREGARASVCALTPSDAGRQTLDPSVLADHERLADELQLDRIDVSDPSLYQKDVWRPYFRRLRRDDPVHYCPESPVGPYWSVTRHKDIIDVEVRHRVFSSSSTLV